MKDCSEVDDLFLHNGHWNTIHISTQCELPCGILQEKICGIVFHSFDEWITSISPEFKAEQLDGIMETNFLKYILELTKCKK